MTAKKEGAKPGRKTVMTPQLIEKLEGCFAKGYTDDEACLSVCIDPQTLYNYCNKYPKFSMTKELLKKTPNIKAKNNIIDGINSVDPIVNLPISRWWAEKKMPEFSPKLGITGADGGTFKQVVYVEKKETKDYLDHIDKVINED